MHLPPGERVRIPYNGGNEARIRSRISGNIKTARLLTGRAFSTYSDKGALYVERSEGR